MNIDNLYLQTSSPNTLDFVGITTYAISIILSLVIVVFSSRFYRISGFFTLGSISIGFTFILASFILGLFNTPIGNDTLHWIKLVFLSYGFTFLALSYFYKIKESEATFHWIVRMCGLSIVPVMLLSLVLNYVLPNEVSGYFTFEVVFRIYNLFVLSYVCKSALQSSIKHGKMEFMYVPIAYAVFWLDQYTWILHNLDENYSTFFLGSVLKVVALTIFVIMFLNINKSKNVVSVNNET
jgi:hypothetical protein